MSAADNREPSFDHRLIDEQLSSRLRLAIMAVLFGCEKIEFTLLKEKVKATDGNLAAHCKKLEMAGYLTVEKLFVNRKPLTLYAATEEGRTALKQYIARLTALLD